MMETTYLNSENISLIENLTGEKIVGLKRKLRISNNKTDGESSRDSNVSSSFSTCMPVDSDTYSDSDFEEHPYSAKKKKLLPKTKSVSGNSKVNVNEDEQIIGAYSCRKEKKKTKCMSKNALMARINRQKKKKYIEDLETKNAELEGENQILKDMLNKSIEEAASLKRQAINLHNVIRNSTEIGSLLKCIHKNTDLQISSSLIKDISRKSLSAIGSKFNEPMFSTPTDIPGNEEALLAALVWGMVLHILPALQADVVSNERLQHQL